VAITRQLLEVRVNFLNQQGDVSVGANAVVTDTDEGTTSGAPKKFNAPQVVAAAEALRDAVVQQYAQQGKPVTF
jgi:hypothetical protein